jgi:hypothetical protein
MNKPPVPTSTMLTAAAKLYDHFGELSVQISIDESQDLPDCFRGKSLTVFCSEDVQVDSDETKIRIRRFLNSGQPTFKDFGLDKSTFCVVSYAEVPDFQIPPPKGTSCSCYVYLKKNVCQHAVAVSMIKGSYKSTQISRVPMQRRAFRIVGEELGSRARYS